MELDIVELHRERPHRSKRSRERISNTGTVGSAHGGDSHLPEDDISARELFHLQCYKPIDGKPESVDFGVEGIRFGRDQCCCDVVAPTRGISRLHCVLSVVGHEVFVHDKSTNGTFINGARIGYNRCSKLRNGDELALVNPALDASANYTYVFTVPEEKGGQRCDAPCTEATGKYILGPSIGQGSFACVRLAVHKQTGEEVAVKVLEKRTFSYSSAFTSLHTEIEMLRSMNHPNIVNVFDAFETPETVALVMEFVRGGDFFDYIAGRGPTPFTEEEARFLFVQLLEALLYIHGRNVVHCDLKPENVLVDVQLPIVSPVPQGTDRDDEEDETVLGSASPSGTPLHGIRPCFSLRDHHQADACGISPFNVRLKLTDFGIAKYRGDRDDDEDGSVPIGGSPFYTAPEVLMQVMESEGAVLDWKPNTPQSTPCGCRASSSITPAMDIWSLGVLLYVMCSGVLPKDAQKSPTVRFSRRMNHLSSHCKDIIQAMMALDPTQRIDLRSICCHPWLEGVTIHGFLQGSGDVEEDLLSMTDTLSPRALRSARASGHTAEKCDPSPRMHYDAAELPIKVARVESVIRRP